MKSKIFYDGNCVVCDIEIGHYKRIAPNEFDLVDISAPDFDAAKFGFDSKDVNREMHVMGPDQTVHVGVEAFRHIWSRIPKYQWLSGLIGQPGIRSVAGVGYQMFSKIRPYLPKRSTLAPT
jgi:predicted DCC family thiol-disulfide oxidoreductase YuxK